MRSNEALEFENRLLKSLLEKGYFMIEYHSTDCDGVHAHSINKYTSLEAFYEVRDSAYEWADGPISFALTDEEEEVPRHSWGHGWDIR